MQLPLAKMRKAYERITFIQSLSPNSKAIKRALHHISTEALLREIQRRNAMPPIPKKDDNETNIHALLGWAQDEEILQECDNRGIYTSNPDAVARIARGINDSYWPDVIEGYGEL